MKSLLVTCLFLFLSILSFSQSESTYCPQLDFTYDGSGNRTQREYADPLCTITSGHSRYSDSNLTVSTYPNPTSGFLTIDISSKDTTCTEPTLVSMYDVNAQPVFLSNESKKKIRLDVSSLPQGTYIVKVVNCNEQSSTVVLKISNSSGNPTQHIQHVTEIVKY